MPARHFYLRLLLPIVMLLGASSTVLARSPSTVPTVRTEPSFVAGAPAIDNFGASWTLGVAPAANQATLGNLAQEAGVRWSREDASWFRIQMPQAQCTAGTYDGTYCWGDLDRAVNLNVARNIQVLLVLQYPMAQYSGNPTAPDFYKYAPTSQAGLNAWSTWVSAVVQRYKDRVHHWQLWYAINDPTVWQLTGGNTTVSVYTPLLQRTYNAVKAADPSAKVVLAATDSPLFTGLLNAGITNFFDVVAMSNYAAYDIASHTVAPIPEASSLVTTRLNSMRDLIQRRVPGRPLWITEYAWGTSPGVPFGVSETEQAQYLIRSMLLQHAQPDVGTILWSFFHDISGGTYNPNDPQDNMGMLVRIDLATRKLSHSAYTAMTTALAGGATFQLLQYPGSSSGLVEGFETGRRYDAYTSAGGSGSLTQVAGGRTGGGAGRLDYAWPGPSGAFVFAPPLPDFELPGPGAPSRVRVWAKLISGNAANLGVDLQDATGERCTASLGVVTGTDWRPYTAYLDAPPDKTTMLTGCAGGNGNLVLEPPLKFLGFTAYGWDQGIAPVAGSILLDDLTFDAGPTIFDLVFNGPSGTVHALWSLAGTLNAVIPTNGPSATVRDWHNASSTVSAVNGSVTVPVNQHPVFVTLASLPPPTCSPRPPVSVRTSKLSPGTLRATVAVSGERNLLTALSVTTAPNTLIDVGTQVGLSGTVSIPVSGSSTSAEFNIRRATPSGAATVSMMVTDRCPTPWKSLAGGGPAAFN